jgi:16S rRNA (cytosine1402-N4)-methyltransferase
MGTSYHNPVLLQEAVDGLKVKENGVYVDVTFGGGGHSREILKRLGSGGRLVAFDQDEDARVNVPDDERFILINENFRFMRQYLKFYGIREVEGILADFGVSSHQFDESERGFSTRFDTMLDMRMSRRNPRTAFKVINNYSYDDLRKVLCRYGELRQADAMARAIVDQRSKGPIKTTSDIKIALGRFLPVNRENKMLARVYQAIRIEVNEELAAIEEFLPQCADLILSGGRMSVICYHSLEDRLVKRYIRDGKFEGEVEKDMYGNVSLPFRKVGGLKVPSKFEIEQNPRARSAKLRIAERL